MNNSIILKILKPVIFIASLIPLCLLIIAALSDDLGANPIETLTHQTGLWGLYFLILTLAVTPLKSLGVSWVVRLRRMLGVYAFFYATLHVLVYFWLDQFFVWDAILEDIVKRPYITVGFTAWILLIPLALTSFNRAMKKLGGNWKKLHKTIYLIVLLVLLHFIWLVKADLAEPLFYLLLTLLLLLMRVPRVKQVVQGLF